ncbi:MAG: hypothetical protein IJ386_04615 [Clostridia bacterium]|nr:hypothetical protein [Clostridia bacterium]
MNANENGETLAIPMGMAMAMAQNPEAMNAFCRLSDRGRSEYIAKARAVGSRGEMDRLVAEIIARG